MINRPITLNIPSLLDTLKDPFLTPVECLVTFNKDATKKEKGDSVRVDRPAVAMSSLERALINQSPEDSEGSGYPHRL